MKKQVTITIDEERLKGVQKVADEENRSVSNMIDAMIRYYLVNVLRDFSNIDIPVEDQQHD